MIFGLLGLSSLGTNGGIPFAFDPASLAIFSAFTTPPSAARKTLINNAVVSLKSGGIWTALDALWMTAAADNQAATINWKSPAAFTLIPDAGITFTADRGFTGNGTTQKVRTQYTPSVSGVNYIQDNASGWVWSLTDTTSAAADIGNATVAPFLSIIPRNASNQVRLIINASTASLFTNSVGSGFFGAQRSGSTALAAYRNGVSLGTAATASTGVPTQEQWLDGAISTQFSSHQIAAGAYGASLAGNEAAFYNAILTYMQGVGAQ